MRTTQSNRYARWAAIIATLVAAIVLIVYARRSWQAKSAKKDAPPPVPSSVQRNSKGFILSKVDHDRTILTLRASNATVYKEGDRTLLTDVWITIFGKNGDQNDNIHTDSCDYLVSAGHITCPGVVLIDLESADEAKRVSSAPAGSPPPKIVHVITKKVTFDNNSGDAATDQPVEFNFPGGEGRAVGANYAGGEGVLDLLHDVHLKLSPPPPKTNPTKSSAPPIDVVGSSLDFQRKAQVMYLHGPVTAHQQVLQASAATHSQIAPSQNAAPQKSAEERELLASLLTVNFDKDLKAKKITATGDAKARPQMRSTSAKGNGSIFADQFIADLAPAGWLEHLSAVGDVQGDYKSATDTNHMAAGRVDVEMVSKLNQPKAVNATGAVRANSVRTVAARGGSPAGTSTRTIETAALALDFAPAPPLRPTSQPRYQLTHARSLAPAAVTLSDPAPPAPASRHAQVEQQASQSQSSQTQMRITHITGQRMDADFGGSRNHVRRIQGQGGAQIDRDLPGAARQTTTSQDFAVNFDDQSQWTTFDQTGNVRMRQADQSGAGSREHTDRATNTVTLYGPGAEASDASSHTTADTFFFNDLTNDVRAEGNVLSTYYGKPGQSSGTSQAPNAGSGGMGSSQNLGSDPTHIHSDHLSGNSAAGHAFYTGHARMWQGDSVMDADEIELNRPASQLDARGNVRAIFLSAASSSSPGGSSAALSSATAKPATKNSKISSPGQSFNARPGAANPSAAGTGPDVWHIRTPKLTYYDSESRAHLDDGFTAESQSGFISGQDCDIYFVPSTQQPGNPASATRGAQPAPQSGAQSAANPSGSSQHIDHAIARGHVLVRQEDRHGTSERADYTAAEGKFVLSGGKPIFFDGDGNSVTGRQLTFYQADDTILVESEDGVRTLTRHRVQK
jgi:lipopolysaccharide export system protein LptA